jgi:hypothetical protein
MFDQILCTSNASQASIAALAGAAVPLAVRQKRTDGANAFDDDAAWHGGFRATGVSAAAR